MTATKLLVKDDERRYFIQVPNLIDDLDLSPYAVRLYLRLKRVAGEKGECWQSVKTLAKACKMSTGTVTNARRELYNAGLIAIQNTDNPHGGRDFITVTIKDIWARNVSEYTPSSYSELASSPGEFTSSPGELKNNPLRITDDSISSEIAELATFFSNNIHPITQAVYDQLPDTVEMYTTEWVRDAILLAANNNARSWAYIIKCLENRRAGRDGKAKRPAKEEKYSEVHR